jgi:hypothetical protein
MAVRVDETGDDRPSSDVERGVGRRRRSGSSDPGDHVVLNDHGCVEPDAELITARTVTGHEFTDSGDHCAPHGVPS